jgi:site-specific recombinase XerD
MLKALQQGDIDRQMMLEELQRRNYSKSTTRYYLQAVASFARHFGKSPDKLGPDELRSDQAYLLRERKLAVGSVIARVAALRFFFVRTLKRHNFREDLPYPKDHRRLPTVLSLEEVARLISPRRDEGPTTLATTQILRATSQAGRTGRFGGADQRNSCLIPRAPA